jgi:hypothetical protein
MCSALFIGHSEMEINDKELSIPQYKEKRPIFSVSK